MKTEKKKIKRISKKSSDEYKSNLKESKNSELIPTDPKNVKSNRVKPRNEYGVSKDSQKTKSKLKIPSFSTTKNLKSTFGRQKSKRKLSANKKNLSIRIRKSKSPNFLTSLPRKKIPKIIERLKVKNGKSFGSKDIPIQKNKNNPQNIKSKPKELKNLSSKFDRKNYNNKFGILKKGQAKNLSLVVGSKFMKNKNIKKIKSRHQSPNGNQNEISKKIRSNTLGISSNISKFQSRNSKTNRSRFSSRNPLGIKFRKPAMQKFSRKKFNQLSVQNKPLTKKSAKKNPKKILNPSLNISKRTQGKLKLNNKMRKQTPINSIRVPRFRAQRDSNLVPKKIKIKQKNMNSIKNSNNPINSPKNLNREMIVIPPRSKSQGLRMPKSALFGLQMKNGSGRIIRNGNNITSRNKLYPRGKMCDYNYRANEYSIFFI